MDPKMVHDTPPSQDVSTHQIWNSYLKEYRRYAPDSMQFLETRSEVKFKVTVTQLWYATLHHLKKHPHTKFEIPTSNNIRYAPDTIILKTRSEVKVIVTLNGTRHSAIPRCIHTPNLEFLPQRILEIWTGHESGTDGLTDGRTVRLLYASQSSFGGITKYVSL